MKVPLASPTRAVPNATGFWKALSLVLLIVVSVLVVQQPDLMHRRTQPEQPAGDGEGRVMVFYHVHAINNWREILLDQCTKLIYSGLYEAATAVSAGISGPTQEAVSDAAEFLRIFGSKFAIIEAHVNSTLAERLTLNRIKELTRPTDRVFYFHSKGVSAHNQAPAQQVKIRAWRDSMEFFLIRHHRQCLRVLRDYDLVGINWIKQGDNWPADDPFNRGVPNVPAGYPSHFSGNFWWASAAFWHTLPDGFLGPQYNEPENAMFRYSPRVACVHYDGLEALGHYYHWLPPRNYTDIATISVVRHS